MLDVVEQGLQRLRHGHAPLLAPQLLPNTNERGEGLMAAETVVLTVARTSTG